MVADDVQKYYTEGQDYIQKAQVFRETIEFWTHIVKQKIGVLTSRLALRLLVKRVQILLKTLKTMTLEQTNVKLTMAYRIYFKARPEFPP